MKDSTNQPANVDAYISSFPDDVQKRLVQMRQTILKAAPDSEELISYQMPAYKYHGMLVYFAAFKNHIGLYPGVSGVANFKNELSAYKGAKGSVQFPHYKPLPLDLVAKIVTFRVRENQLKAEAKKKTKA
jgi:uncharacterized protein YdhG (YjbR/CyaY superfamily)